MDGIFPVVEQAKPVFSLVAAAGLSGMVSGSVSALLSTVVGHRLRLKRSRETFGWLGYQRDRKPSEQQVEHRFGPGALRCVCGVQVGRGMAWGWPFENMVADPDWIALHRFRRPTIWIARHDVELVAYSALGFGRMVFFRTRSGDIDGVVASAFGREGITGNLARLGWPVPPLARPPATSMPPPHVPPVA